MAEIPSPLPTPKARPDDTTRTGMTASLAIGKRYGSPQLAALWGYASHQALSRGVFTPKGRNGIFLFVTRMKQKV